MDSLTIVECSISADRRFAADNSSSCSVEKEERVRESPHRHSSCAFTKHMPSEEILPSIISSKLSRLSFSHLPKSNERCSEQISCLVFIWPAMLRGCGIYLRPWGAATTGGCVCFCGVELVVLFIEETMPKEAALKEISGLSSKDLLQSLLKSQSDIALRKIFVKLVVRHSRQYRAAPVRSSHNLSIVTNMTTPQIQTSVKRKQSNVCLNLHPDFMI